MKRKRKAKKYADEKQLENNKEKGKKSAKDTNKRLKKGENMELKLDSVANEILSNEELNRVFDVCDHSEKYLENNFIVKTMGLLGFRVGEAAHFRKSWVNFEKKTIRIPAHEPCDCSYCQERVREQLKKREYSKEESKTIAKKIVSKYYWHPKTTAGSRFIYYGFNAEYERILNEFFSKYDQWPYTVNTAERRIKKLLNLADLGDHKSHDLRKTAGSNFAAKGLNEYELMQIMGWEDSKVAKKYIRLSGVRGVESQKKNLGTGSKKVIINDSRIIFYLTSLGRKLFTRRKRKDDGIWLKSIIFKPDKGNDPVKQLSLEDL